MGLPGVDKYGQEKSSRRYVVCRPGPKWGIFSFFVPSLFCKCSVSIPVPTFNHCKTRVGARRAKTNNAMAAVVQYAYAYVWMYLRQSYKIKGQKQVPSQAEKHHL